MVNSEIATIHMEDFGPIWQQTTEVRFTQRREVEEETAYCPAAQELADWVERHILSVKEDAEVTAVKASRDQAKTDRAKRAIYQAKLNLQDAYWRAYFPLPSSHQTHVGNRGHVCIFHVYKQAWQELDQMLRSVAPPPLVIVQTVVQERVIEKPVTWLHLGDKEYSLE